MTIPALEAPKLLPTLGLFACIAIWFAFGDIAFFRAVGILFVAHGLSHLFTKSVPVGIKGFKPTFYVTGQFAVLFGLGMLCIGLLITIFAKQVSCLLGNQCL